MHVYILNRIRKQITISTVRGRLTLGLAFICSALVYMDATYFLMLLIPVLATLVPNDREAVAQLLTSAFVAFLLMILEIIARHRSAFEYPKLFGFFALVAVGACLVAFWIRVRRKLPKEKFYER